MINPDTFGAVLLTDVAQFTGKYSILLQYLVYLI